MISAGIGAPARGSFRKKICLTSSQTIRRKDKVEDGSFADGRIFQRGGASKISVHMKKIITSAGLMALGAAGVQAAVMGTGGYEPGFGAPDMSRPWSVSASLRGFYDDNYLTAPDHQIPGSPISKQGSWGMTFNPSVSLAWSDGQTDMGAK